MKSEVLFALLGGDVVGRCAKHYLKFACCHVSNNRSINKYYHVALL